MPNLKALVNKKLSYCEICEDAGVAVLLTDNKGNVCEANKPATELSGYTKRELLGHNILQLLPSKHIEQVLISNANKGLDTNIRLVDIPFKKKSGLTVTGDLIISTIKNDSKRMLMVLATNNMNHDTYNHSFDKERLKQLYSVIPSAIFTVDSSSVLTSFNKAAEELTGYSSEEVLGKKCTLFAIGSCARGCGLFEFADQIDEPIMGKICEIRRKDGEIRTISKNIDLIRDVNGAAVGGIESFEDITEQKKAQEVIKHMAYHDSLTGLPNRALFGDRFSIAIEHAKRHGEKLGLLFVDIDDFKTINDSFGHAMGDKLLISVAQRFKDSVRGEDTVARFGGDEFAMLISCVNNHENIEAFARRVMEALRAPFHIEAEDLYITISMGIAMCPDDGLDEQTLLKNADKALYKAKELGKDTHQCASTADFKAS